MTKHIETAFTFMRDLPTIADRLIAVRRVAVVPLIIGGLLALGSDSAHAQRCFTCDGADREDQDEGNFGFTGCWMGEVLGKDMCMPRDSELCEVDGEEGGWALSPGEEALENEAVLAMVHRGGMLPADSRYFIATRGDQLVVRKKCGGSLVGVVALRGTAQEQGRVT